jgi:hypothetical protein
MVCKLEGNEGRFRGLRRRTVQQAQLSQVVQPEHLSQEQSPMIADVMFEELS